MTDKIRDNTNRFALIGKGISYSVSPRLHKTLVGAKGIDDMDYEIIDIDDLENAMPMLRARLSGFNVTKPYKVDIIKYLDEIDERARCIGSVNTVTNIDGVLRGYNTDLDGIIDTFNKDGVSLISKSALIIGYGGVALTLVFALSKMGATHIAVTGRNMSKMLAFKDMAHDKGIDIEIDADITHKYAVVINATTVGTGDDTNMPISPDKLDGVEYYFDLIYTPRRTRLARALESKGTKIRDGLYMLVSQAGRADEYYLGVSMNDNDMESAYRLLAGEIFANKLRDNNIDNVVLVGFMGVGKSTIGKRLAGLLDADFIDTDSEIERLYGDIPTIFSDKGEVAFRDIESKVLCDVLSRHGVIATGGGIVMRDDNIDLLKRSNSLVIYLDADFSTIRDRVKGSDRPLFRDETKARDLYDFRRDRYMECCDATYRTDNGADSTIDEILKY